MLKLRMPLDPEEYLSDTAHSTNKLLATLHSGAFIAFVHFGDKDVFNTFKNLPYPSPLKAFAFGLTLILLTYAMNYFQALEWNILGAVQNFYGKFATVSAIFSAFSFLYGVWYIACILT